MPNTQTRSVGQSLTKREKFNELLLKITNDMAASKTLDDALETLVGITSSTIGGERGTIFLNDKNSQELYSRVAQGNFRREIRIMNTKGVAGWVFSNKEGAIILDAYKDDRFDKSVDMRTGYRTKSILCAPLKTVGGEVIGVSQILNKIDGKFNNDDLEMLEAMTKQAAIAIQGNIIVEQIEKSRKQELEFLDIVSQVSSELELGPLLERIIGTVTKMLNAERSTLFINDEKTNELYTEVAEGVGKTVIRFPNHLGIAGTVFTSGQALNIPHAYADLRFNPGVDRSTGYFTRSMLCTPVINKEGRRIGVCQVLNKRDGPFTDEDQKRLAAFTSQISMAIENAKLFNDVQNEKNYSQGMLSSMSNGVITVDENGKIITCNPAGLNILKIGKLKEVLGQKIKDLFTGSNVWLVEKIQGDESQDEEDEDDEDEPKKKGEETFMDVELEFGGETVSANISVLPLLGVENESLGSLIMIEDISSEKRMKSTMSRYMDPGLADKLLDESEEDIMGGKESLGTVLFSDVRSFTTLTESLGATGTVSLLNEYFTVMVDCITGEGGMLDKFIGDAIMAIFGTPFAHDDDPDRGVRAAIKMMEDLYILNDARVKDGQLAIDHGMGVNTGMIVSGNIGSPKRMDYTVIGDGVNLAARLESACKQYGVRIIISEYTFESLKATYRTREIDKVIVKGKTKPVSIFEVLDYHNKDTSPNMIEVLGNFNNGVDYYKDARWDDAKKLFKEGLKGNSEDKCSKMYVERCEYMKKNPPEGEWDGVWVMKTK
ncbi:MAG: GAF domain-containing protein [Candidatus Neomarinimicrobiota bacterium]|nr:GAF domain-containing protein [Candidatus Neomarinimicrobiota bacterium]